MEIGLGCILAALHLVRKWFILCCYLGESSSLEKYDTLPATGNIPAQEPWSPYSYSLSMEPCHFTSRYPSSRRRLSVLQEYEL